MVAPKGHLGETREPQRRGSVIPAPLPLADLAVVRAPEGGYTIARPVDASRSTLRIFDARRWSGRAAAQAALEAELAAPAVMRRVCAWCQADLGVVPCAPAQAGQITHGMCRPCADKMVAAGRPEGAR